MMPNNDRRGKKPKKESKKEAKKRLNLERRANKRDKKDLKSVSELYITQLERIVSREPAAIEPLLAPHKWDNHSCGNTLLGATLDWTSRGGDTAAPLFNPTQLQLTASHLKRRGCTVVENNRTPTTTTSPCLWGPPNPTFNWGKEYNDILLRVDATMESLKAAGWPPVFVFLFDEPWLLIDRLFELVAPLLGEDCLLESSMYAWALSRSEAADTVDTAAAAAAAASSVDGSATTTHTPTATTPRAAEVGGNFPVPHRDNSFAEANFPDGSPSHLSTWMCINHVGLDNGCMHVLPKDADARFFKSNDYWHERVAYPTAGLDLNQKLPTRKIKPPVEQVLLNFPLDKALPIPAPRGSILLWQPNCIHWGSSCSASSHLPPRKSMAMTFRCSAKKRPVSSIERDLLTREQIRLLTIEDRLVMVVESIVMYAKWFPSFQKFDLGLLSEGSGLKKE